MFSNCFFAYSLSDIFKTNLCVVRQLPWHFTLSSGFTQWNICSCLPGLSKRLSEQGISLSQFLVSASGWRQRAFWPTVPSWTFLGCCKVCPRPFYANGGLTCWGEGVIKLLASVTPLLAAELKPLSFRPRQNVFTTFGNQTWFIVFLFHAVVAVFWMLK